jgi:hypothetical protein
LQNATATVVYEALAFPKKGVTLSALILALARRTGVESYEFSGEGVRIRFSQPLDATGLDVLRTVDGCDHIAC